jgi:hypothetical protein
MMKHIILGCPRPVRERVRSTCLHGFEASQVLNTEGERYKEARRGVPIAERTSMRWWREMETGDETDSELSVYVQSIVCRWRMKVTSHVTSCLEFVVLKISQFFNPNWNLWNSLFSTFDICENRVSRLNFPLKNNPDKTESEAPVCHCWPCRGNARLFYQVIIKSMAHTQALRLFITKYSIWKTPNLLRYKVHPQITKLAAICQIPHEIAGNLRVDFREEENCGWAFRGITPSLQRHCSIMRYSRNLTFFLLPLFAFFAEVRSTEVCSGSRQQREADCDYGYRCSCYTRSLPSYCR